MDSSTVDVTKSDVVSGYDSRVDKNLFSIPSELSLLRFSRSPRRLGIINDRGKIFHEHERSRGCDLLYACARYAFFDRCWWMVAESRLKCSCYVVKGESELSADRGWFNTFVHTSDEPLWSTDESLRIESEDNDSCESFHFDRKEGFKSKFLYIKTHVYIVYCRTFFL